MLAMLSASGASPSLRSLPLAGSIARLTTLKGCERNATYSTFLSGLTAIGMAVPPSGTVSTGLSVAVLRSSSNTETSWLSALATYTQVAAQAPGVDSAATAASASCATRVRMRGVEVIAVSRRGLRGSRAWTAGCVGGWSSAGLCAEAPSCWRSGWVLSYVICCRTTRSALSPQACLTHAGITRISTNNLQGFPTCLAEEECGQERASENPQSAPRPPKILTACIAILQSWLYDD